MNIVLIGMRGVGKTTVARHLALLTKRPVLATDLLLSYDHGGQSVAQIVAAAGGDWRRFRDLEHAVVAKVAALDGLIVDCGGGVVVDLDAEGQEIYSQRKMDALKAHGRVVWLQGDLARQATEARADANRPALSTRLSEEEVMARRLPFYERAAEFTVTVEGRTAEEVAREIIGLLGLVPVA